MLAAGVSPLLKFFPCELEELGHSVLSYFGHVQALNGWKPENNSLIKYKTTNEIIINQKGTRMVKDGED